MTPVEVINIYNGISQIMGAMVHAAKRRDWESLQALENQCRPLTRTLMESEAEVELDDHLKREKLDLLRKILADDTAIRHETQPWMDELQQLIRSTGSQQKLNKAYGSGMH
jgi:flagellar protein FliT